MSRPALALVLLTAGLAGCVGDDTPGSTEGLGEAQEDGLTPGATHVPRSLTFTGCTEHAGFFPVPASAYRDRLPEGFSLKPYWIADSVLPEGAGKTAAVSVASWRCEGPDEEGPTLYANAKLGVVPPAEYREDSLGSYRIGLFGFTTNETFAEAFQRWGLTGYQEAEIDRDTAGTAAASWARTEAINEEAELELATSVQGPHASNDGGSTRTFYVEDGDVTGAVDITVSGYEYAWTSVEDATAGEAVLRAPAALPIVSGTGGDAAHYWGFDTTYRGVDLTSGGGRS